MNTYGFTSIVHDGQGASAMHRVRVGHNQWIEWPQEIVKPEPGQTISDFSSTGNPPGIIVKQEGQEPVWVFILFGRVFATCNLNANPYELWLSWAFCRPHADGRWQGLRRPRARNVAAPLLVDLDTLGLPESAEVEPPVVVDAREQFVHDLNMARTRGAFGLRPEKLAVFRDRIYQVEANGTYRRLRGSRLQLAQKILLAAAGGTE